MERGRTRWRGGGEDEVERGRMRWRGGSRKEEKSEFRMIVARQGKREAECGLLDMDEPGKSGKT